MAAPCPEQSAEEILERNARIRRIRRVLVDETGNGSEGSVIPHVLNCAFEHFHTKKTQRTAILALSCGTIAMASGVFPAELLHPSAGLRQMQQKRGRPAEPTGSERKMCAFQNDTLTLFLRG
jgi:hypothetical protein